MSSPLTAPAPATPATVSRLTEMTALGADWWNDSGAPDELAEAVALGATGGTSNPVIVSQTARTRPDLCLPVLERLLIEHPAATEDDLAWKLIHTLGRESARRLLPVFEATRGAKGYLSMQVNPKFHPHRDHMVAQAVELAALAPNIAIKVPATAAGIAAMEEMTARGIRINATVSFSVAQVLAVSAAIERGLARARAAGLAAAADSLRPYITLMVGRVDDHLKRVAEAEKISTTPGVLDQAGIAVFKHAARLLREQGRPGTLLAAAYRNEAHWREIIGPDVLQTIPYTWWKKFEVSTRPVTATLDQPIDDAVLAELHAKFPDFTRAYAPEGMAPAGFVRYGATVHTLHQFLEGYADLVSFVRTAQVR
jgi:transaldolase